MSGEQLVECADCGRRGDPNGWYMISRPAEQGEFYLCIRCWDRLVGAALLSEIR